MIIQRSPTSVPFPRPTEQTRRRPADHGVEAPRHLEWIHWATTDRQPQLIPVSIWCLIPVGAGLLQHCALWSLCMDTRIDAFVLIIFVDHHLWYKSHDFMILWLIKRLFFYIRLFGVNHKVSIPKHTYLDMERWVSDNIYIWLVGIYTFIVTEIVWWKKQYKRSWSAAEDIKLLYMTLSPKHDLSEFLTAAAQIGFNYHTYKLSPWCHTNQERNISIQHSPIVGAPGRLRTGILFFIFYLIYTNCSFIFFH